MGSSRAAGAVTAGAVGVGLGVLVRVRWAPLARVDALLTTRLHGWAVASPVLRTASTGVSTVAGPSTVRVGAGLLALPLLRRHRTRDAVRLLLAVEGSGLLSVTVKTLVGRPRPSVAPALGTASGWSYPSGHALAALVGTGALLALPASRPGAVLAVGVPLTLAVGGSRVTLGLHHPADVAGGWLLGVGWLGLVRALTDGPPDAG